MSRLSREPITIPAVVAAVLTFVVTLGFDIDTEAAEGVILAAIAGVTGLFQWARTTNWAWTLPSSPTALGGLVAAAAALFTTVGGDAWLGWEFTDGMVASIQTLIFGVFGLLGRETSTPVSTPAVPLP